ncbi:hypothetical protein ACKUT0_20940 [Klebsiella oxytoca]
MSALYQKAGPQGDRLPVPWLCFLEEQTFSGYGFTYTLSLARVSAPGKMSPGGKSRRKCRAASETSISSLNSHLLPIIYKLTIGSFIGAPVSHGNALSAR